MKMAVMQHQQLGADAAAGDDIGGGGDGGTQYCIDHPYPTNPGGICAFCLQEKLGKLVSSSKFNPFSSAAITAPSSSISPSDADFRIDGGRSSSGIPFFPTDKTKKKKMAMKMSSDGDDDSSSNSLMMLRRSRSVAPAAARASDGRIGGVDRSSTDNTPRKTKSFWSFLHRIPPSSSSSSSAARARKRIIITSAGEDVNGGASSASRHAGGDVVRRSAAPLQIDAPNAAVVVPRDEVESPSGGSQASSSFDRKVARSRSVGCGSRSFSGDFLERLSTGFGDCTLRRVESQRETAAKHAIRGGAGGLRSSSDDLRECDDDDDDGDGGDGGRHQMVRCGGRMFGGLGMISGAPSSSSYRLSAAAGVGAGADHHIQRMAASGRSWGWAFASPMRAFRPSSASSSGHHHHHHHNKEEEEEDASIDAAARAISRINRSIVDGGGAGVAIGAGQIIDRLHRHHHD